MCSRSGVSRVVAGSQATRMVRAITAVLHTWGSALTHHPHAHIIVPGGGLSPDGQHWIAGRPRFFLSVEVLSRLFRRLFLDRLIAAYQAGRLEFFANQADLAEPAAFKAWLAALRKVEWVVYAKRPFGGPRRCARLPVPLHSPHRDCQQPARTPASPSARSAR